MARFFVTGDWDRTEVAGRIDVLWREWQEAEPDLEGHDADYEANWAGTLGLDPAEVRYAVSRVLSLTPYYGPDARDRSEALGREARALTAVDDDLGAYAAEEEAALYGQGGWEVEALATLVPPAFVSHATRMMGTWVLGRE